MNIRKENVKGVLCRGKKRINDITKIGKGEILTYKVNKRK